MHPDRAFHENEQVRKNWSAIFSSVPDFRAELLRSAVEGEAVWSEWHWSGTHSDGRPFAMRGVTIFGVRDDRIVWDGCTWNPCRQQALALTPRYSARRMGRCRRTKTHMYSSNRRS